MKYGLWTKADRHLTIQSNIFLFVNTIKMMQTRNSRIFITTVIFILIFYLSINSLTTYDQLNMSIENNSNSQVRIHCLILTSTQYLDTRARAVNDTWGSRCDKFHFISEYVNDTKGLPIAPIANITPGYDHLTQKTTRALHFAYENSLNDTDWFVKTDDDTYLFVENLKQFLKGQNTSLPITFGYNFKVCISDNDIYSKMSVIILNDYHSSMRTGAITHNIKFFFNEFR